VITAQLGLVKMTCFSSGLVALLSWLYGPIGFNPTDDGIVLSLSRRILQGQVPHAQIINPQPLGSGYLHLVELFLPGPLLFDGRVVTLIEILIINVAWVYLATGKSLRQWSLLNYFLVTVGVLITINVFPLMPWDTVDGTLFTAIGLAAVTLARRKNSYKLCLLAFVALGSTCLIKQGFVLSPLLGLMVLRANRRGRQMPVIWIVLASGAAPVCYTAYVTAHGGFGQMLVQLTQTAPLHPFASLNPAVSATDGVVDSIVCLAAIVALAYLPSRSGATREHQLQALRVGAICAVLLVPMLGRYQSVAESQWAVSIFLIGSLLLVWGALHRSADTLLLVALLTAWMDGLSWGNPSLSSGISFAAIVILDRMDIEGFYARVRASGAALAWGTCVVLLGASIGILTMSRYDYPYRDRPTAELTRNLDQVSSEFGPIRTNPTTYAYLLSMKHCIASHAAEYVAVLPDNPAIYPIFNVRSPFPIDWMYPLAYTGSKQRIVRALAFDNSHSHLILFQTVLAQDLASRAALPTASARTQIVDYPGTGLQTYLFDHTSGKVIRCGSFIGKYLPTDGVGASSAWPLDWPTFVSDPGVLRWVGPGGPQSAGPPDGRARAFVETRPFR